MGNISEHRDDMKTKVSTSFNIRDGVVLIFVDGELIYDGLPTAAPKHAVEHPNAYMLMHPHMKDRMDAGIKARAKQDRLEAEQRGKMMRLHKVNGSH